MAKDDSKKPAGASWILRAFADLENLMLLSSGYSIHLVEMEQKYSKDNEMGFDGLEEQDKQTLLTNIYNLKTVTYMMFVRMCALKDKINSLDEEINIKVIVKEDDKEKEDKIKVTRLDYLKNLFDKITLSPIPHKKDVLDYTVALNEIFVSDVLGELLLQSKDIVGGLVNV